MRKLAEVQKAKNLMHEALTARDASFQETNYSMRCGAMTIIRALAPSTTTFSVCDKNWRKIPPGRPTSELYIAPDTSSSPRIKETAPMTVERHEIPLKRSGQEDAE